MFPHQELFLDPSVLYGPSSKFAQAVTLLTGTQKVPGSNLEKDTNQTKGVWPKEGNTKTGKYAGTSQPFCCIK
jgi:hypothetical protein